MRAGGRARAVGGALEVWRVDLSRVGGAEPEGLLCPCERARAARIVDVRRRARWERSRGVLRALLSRYLDADPRELRFAAGAHGKPALRERAGAEAAPGAWSDLRFNLSHAGEQMLVAVSAAREVGVDVERERRRYTAEFLRAWTVREARAKCLGVGLGAKPTAGGGAPEEVWTAELDIGPGAFAAVALAGAQACELRLLDWTS